MPNLLTRIFSGGTAEDRSAQLRSYIDEKLPHYYVVSPKYERTITRRGRTYSARLVLDMEANGADTGLRARNISELSELEAYYLFSSCIDAPPVPTNFTLVMDFGAQNVSTVERGAGKSSGTLTYQGNRTTITF
jgi:hypothetical protein